MSATAGGRSGGGGSVRADGGRQELETVNLELDNCEHALSSIRIEALGLCIYNIGGHFDARQSMFSFAFHFHNPSPRNHSIEGIRTLQPSFECFNHATCHLESRKERPLHLHKRVERQLGKAAARARVETFGLSLQHCGKGTKGEAAIQENSRAGAKWLM